MVLSNFDAACVWDMLRAIAEIKEDTTGLSFGDFQVNRLVRRAVERNLIILGEAARRVSEVFRLAHPEVDWRGMIGLRNILAHQYEKVRDEILWDVVTGMLSTLEKQLQGFLDGLKYE
jgi:uncharacterized protein with HEPN domain